MDGVDLGHNAKVALAVALGTDNTYGRLVDQIRIGAKFLGKANRLAVAAGMVVDDDDMRIRQG